MLCQGGNTCVSTLEADNPGRIAKGGGLTGGTYPVVNREAFGVP